MGRMKRAGKRILIVAIVVVAAYAVGRVSCEVIFAAKVRSEVKLLEAEGGSLRVEDLAPKWALGDRTNAAYLILAAQYLRTGPQWESAHEQQEKVDFADQSIPEEQKADDAWREFDDWRGLHLYRTVSERYAAMGQAEPEFEWDEKWAPYLEGILAENEEALALVKMAANDGRGAFDAGWGSETMRFFHHSTLGMFAGMLRIEAVLSARNGNMAEAMEDARLIFRLRRLIDEEPMFVSKLCCWRLDNTGYGALQGILEFGTPDRQSVESILEELKDREEANRLVNASLGETASGLSRLRKLRGNSKNLREFMASYDSIDGGYHFGVVAREPYLTLFKALWCGKADEYNYLAAMRKGREAMRRYPADGVQEISDYKRPSLPFAVFSRLLGIDGRTLLMLEGQADAGTAMARTVLALALYKADKGTYPDTLDALLADYLPVIQTDPFDGKPLRYKRRGEGFVVYSVYRDRADDGGVWGFGHSSYGDWTWEREK